MVIFFIFFSEGCGEYLNKIDDFYELLGPYEGENKKFRIKTMEYQILWKNMAESRNIEGSMENAIGEVLRRIYAEGRRGDLLAVTIYHPALDDPLYIGYSREEK